MNSEQLSSIIETCGAQGVSSIVISREKVEIKFYEPQAPIEYHLDLGKNNQSQPQATPDTPTGDLETPLEYAAEDPKSQSEADELAELQINNPLEFEERLARGELVDAQTEND